LNNKSSLLNGICPICGSDDIYNNSNTTVSQSRRLPLSGWGSAEVKLAHICCADCGYIETYMAIPEDREKMRKHWTPLNKQKRKRKNDEL
jgi:hypothetical protein